MQKQTEELAKKSALQGTLTRKIIEQENNINKKTQELINIKTVAYEAKIAWQKDRDLIHKMKNAATPFTRVKEAIKNFENEINDHTEKMKMLNNAFNKVNSGLEDLRSLKVTVSVSESLKEDYTKRKRELENCINTKRLKRNTYIDAMKLIESV
tara:strand:- start:139 stop:600 length:462 start_codon:yes stop_codon:yes gene_type:complete